MPCTTHLPRRSSDGRKMACPKTRERGSFQPGDSKRSICCGVARGSMRQRRKSRNNSKPRQGRKISGLVHPLQTQTTRSYKSENMRIVKILFSLEGRINRAEFWVGLASIALFTVVMLSLGRHVYAMGGQGARVLGAVVYCAWLFVFGWTLVAVSTKGCHYMNLSGLMTLLWLIPFVGPIIVIGWLGFRSVKHSRRRHHSDLS